MSNEYPPRPTEMCEPVINGTNVVSDVCDYFINKLKKAIDEYWQSKYPTFATGRIKRMRTRREPRFLLSHSDFFYPIMRWTRH